MVERQEGEIIFFIEIHGSFVSRSAGQANARNSFFGKMIAQSVNKLAAHAHSLIFGKNINVKMSGIFVLELFLGVICG